ncbi:hypothetical protein EJ03DRAFT_185871 [Teratosphaeria nubilosa]|uniref:Uncharacterized protein n=1 Tax=Teratosphaeria nubilosa TaxID=161662 RepID=A0A6G1LI01_9PEZI|nr:hypothetical protein EJ03DRAFT_185871 [Teratosphaeria nubilosa]
MDIPNPRLAHVVDEHRMDDPSIRNRQAVPCILLCWMAQAPQSAEARTFKEYQHVTGKIERERPILHLAVLCNYKRVKQGALRSILGCVHLVGRMIYVPRSSVVAQAGGDLVGHTRNLPTQGDGGFFFSPEVHSASACRCVHHRRSSDHVYILKPENTILAYFYSRRAWTGGRAKALTAPE